MPAPAQLVQSLLQALVQMSAVPRDHRARQRCLLGQEWGLMVLSCRLAYPYCGEGANAARFV